jgi:hypothetical protein
MAKPRRKHPGIGSIEESPQGRYCLMEVCWVLGTEAFAYRALERLKDGTHIFLIGGPRGRGLLVERKEKGLGSGWRSRYGIIVEPDSGPVVWHMDLFIHRWDPWLHAEVSGDTSLLEAPARERRRFRDVMRRESGRRQDRLVTRVLPFDVVPRRVAGIPRDVIDGVLAKHGLLEAGFAAPRPPHNRPLLADDAVSGSSPGWE